MKIDSTNWLAAATLAAIAVFPLAASSSAHAKASIFSPGDNSFSVSFPGKPTCVQQEAGAPGALFTVHTCAYSQAPARLLYSVTFFKIPPTKVPLDNRRLLQVAMDGQAAAANSRVLEVKDVSVGSYPGLQGVIQDPDGSITSSQAIVAEGQLITLVIGDGKKRVAPEVASNFFSSLKVNRPDSRKRP